MSTTTRNKKGFTLIETLVAITLGIAVSIAAIYVFVSGLKHIQAARQMSYLQSNATFLANTFNYWIKQAEGLESDGFSLNIILPGEDKLIIKDGSDIKINGVVFNDEKVEVQDLSFNKLENSVQINFTLKVKSSAEVEPLQIETTIAKRNNYAN